ncbi:PadR family transcriptional regulator [Streptomyces hawaiiensis]|uniref:PadR family transcriptional regulator n=1 Tax=Streptomyces hawaiiensis TaxID=67305 RepID=UPI0036460593
MMKQTPPPEAAKIRITRPTEDVLRVMVDRHVDGGAEAYGLELCGIVGHGAGTVYPLLRRLVRAGWLISRLDEDEEREVARPARIYYRLNPDALGTVTCKLAEADDRRRKLASSSLSNPAVRPWEAR